ncbi:MAG TPA: aconitase family protein, partial [Myxococcales bacterium]|nr:aconitase family protein [Myxococcales bacterium]
LVLGALVLEQVMKDRPAQPASPKKLVVPGDLSIQARLKQAGLWDFYERAGFRIGPPGCSMCLGVASEKALPGEVWLSSQNRNYENRMGQGSLAWLATGVTVAASAVEMKLADPRPLLDRVDRDRFHRILERPSPSSRRAPDVHASEPEIQVAQPPAGATATAAAATAAPPLRGRVQRFGDNVDTDAIIPGEFCHLTKLEEIGPHAFHHVRPEFYPRAQAGRTIVVAGVGWGSGSSREQAVWALRGAGIQAVIARSFAFIHKRNLVNDALPYLVITDPRFYDLAAEDSDLSIDLAAGTVTHAASGQTFTAERPSPIVQALQREGGLVPAIRHHGPKVFDALGGAA